MGSTRPKPLSASIKDTEIQFPEDRANLSLLLLPLSFIISMAMETEMEEKAMEKVLKCVDLLDRIIQKVSNGEDRKRCAEVSRLWRSIEGASRTKLRIHGSIQNQDEIPEFIDRYENLNTLEVVDLISNSGIKLLCYVFGEKIETLDLGLFLKSGPWMSWDFGDQGLKEIAKKCTKLHQLYLRSRKNVTDTGIRALREHKRQLTVLELQSCTSITDLSLKEIAEIGSLLRLNIMNCQEITNVGVQYLSEGPVTNSLIVLKISSRNITDIGALSKFLYLEKLILSGISGMVITDWTISSLNASLHALRKIDFSFQKLITDDAIAGFLGSHNGIRSVEFDQCERVSDKTLYAMGGMKISSLSLRGCQSITDEGLTLLCEGVGITAHLKKIDLSGCVEITDAGIQKLPLLHALQKLVLRSCGCKYFADEAVQVAASILSLRSLDISGQKEITSSTLIVLAEKCPHLIEMCLYDCDGVATCKGISYLSSVVQLESIKMPNLVHLGPSVLSYVTEISDKCPSLKSIELKNDVKEWFPDESLRQIGCEIEWM